MGGAVDLDCQPSTITAGANEGHSGMASTKAGLERPQFFARTALIMVAMAISSFPFTYLKPFATGSRQFATLHHVHGLAFFTWLGLYVWQTQLAATGKIARHREIGLAALMVSGAMLPLGWWMTLYAARARMARGQAFPTEFSLYNVVDISLFTICVIAAVLTVTRNIEWHRRLMFAAAINLVGPAISRWFLPLPEVYPYTDLGPNILADLFLIALALHDRKVLGRVHPATIIAALVMVPLHIIEPLIARSEGWNAIAPALIKID